MMSRVLMVFVCLGILATNAVAMGKKPQSHSGNIKPPVPVQVECNLARPEIRQMVTEEFKTRTDADLSKAYWLNNIKSDTYSVFIVQFKRHDSVVNEDKVYTLTAAVTCDAMGLPAIESVLDWAIPLSAMTNL